MDAEKERPRAIWTNVRLHVVSDVDDYRALATRLAGDAAGCVIELGGATGETTALLAERASRVVVVEKGRQRAQMLWRRFSGRENVVVVHADANDLDVVRATLSRAQCLFVDLGGDAPAWTTMAVVERYVRAFRPAAVVVRNTAVAQFLAATAAEPEGTSALASAPSGLSSTHKPEVRRAARMLAAAATPEAASHLASLLVDADARTRRAASQGLLALGAMSLSPLAAILEDRGADVRARRTAAALIVRIGTLAIADLVGLMRSASPAAEWAAATALVRGGAPDAALKLLPSCPAARLAACHESNRMSAVADVVALLADGDEVVAWALRRHLRKHRGRAARSLGRFVLFADASPAEKAVALQALASVAPEHTRTLARRVAEKRSGETLRESLWSLASAAVALPAPSQAEDVWRQVEALWEGNSAPLQLVRRIVADEPAQPLSRREIQALAKACAREACPPAAPLSAGLRSPHARIRERCARALGWLAVKESHRELERLNDDPVPEVRRAARSVLESLARARKPPDA